MIKNIDTKVDIKNKFEIIIHPKSEHKNYNEKKSKDINFDEISALSFRIDYRSLNDADKKDNPLFITLVPLTYDKIHTFTQSKNQINR